MASKVFMDANVLLDFALQRERFAEAKNLIQKGIDGTIRLFTTTSILHITGYWLSKEYGSVKAKQVILALLSDVRVIDCDHATTLMALQSGIDDIEDALQYYTALKHNLEYFNSSIV